MNKCLATSRLELDRTSRSKAFYSSRAADEFKDDIAFIVDDTKLGEQLIKQKLEEAKKDILDIASHYNAIKLAVTSEEFRCNCTQVQDLIVHKLGVFSSRIAHVVEKLQSSSISSINKQRYFLNYSCGMIEHVRQLLQIVGRLSGLDEKVYLEEQRKPLISDESIAIHTLSFIWIHAINILGDFHDMTLLTFKEELVEDVTIRKLDFFSALFQYTKIYHMDLTLTSWMQFNRLVKYDDLKGANPFLCACQETSYFTTMIVPDIDKDAPKDSISNMLTLILSYNEDVAYDSLRHYDILPYEPCFKTASTAQLSYFAVWHLYCLSNRWPENGSKKGSKRVPSRDMLSGCSDVIDNVLNTVLQQFIPTSSNSQQVSPQEHILLSPHQQERFKLLFVMLNDWIEKNPFKTNLSILTKVFAFFDKNWLRLGADYFDKPTFRLEGLTLFQLFAKLLNEVKPMYTVDGQAMTSLDDNEKIPSREELELSETWNNLLNKVKPPTNNTTAQNSDKGKP